MWSVFVHCFMQKIKSIKKKNIIKCEYTLKFKTNNKRKAEEGREGNRRESEKEKTKRKL